MYPPRPNYAVLLIVLAIALVVCVAMYVQLEHGLAANDASKVSLDLSAEVKSRNASATQRRNAS
jgi:hypothetical protein